MVAMGMINSGSSRSKKKVRGINDASVVLIFLTLLLAIVFVLDELGSDNAEPVEERVQSSSIEPSGAAALEKFLAEVEEQTIFEGANGSVIVESDAFEKFEEIYREHLKAEFGNVSDFVIYFEDDQGNLLKLTEKPCFGSGSAAVNGHACNE